MPARILIIEDNPANLELMSYLLAKFGHVVWKAEDSEEGLAIAHLEKPDLIVCDIQLAGTDGYAVAREIRTDPALQATPIVAVTAFAMVGDRDKILNSGFDGYISKPIAPEGFVAQIEDFLPAEQRVNYAVTTLTLGASISKRGTGKRARILAVDDRPTNLSFKRNLFEPLGYTVFTARSVAEALKVAHETAPDLILSDLGMGEASGFDFIRVVKEDPQLKDVPFIFITSTYCDEATRAKGLALGADRFLFRPIDPKVLLAEVEACLLEASRKVGRAEG